MTEKELCLRYKPSKALKLSIEKWIRLGYKENWKKLLVYYLRYLGGGTCGLCGKYAKTHCVGCSLSKHTSYCGQANSGYNKAYLAIRSENRSAFMSARKYLLRRMNRAFSAI